MRLRKKLAITLAVFGGALAVAPVGGSVGRYVDATGDGGQAPDITGMLVGSDAGGQLLFTITMSNVPIGTDAATLLFVNADMNTDTGRPQSLGADYMFDVEHKDSEYGFARWNGTAWEWDTPSTTVVVAHTATNVMISVNRTELGGSGSISFWARTVVADGNEGQYDDAPNDSMWSYSLAAGGPDIQGVLMSTDPSFGPRAGRPFTVKAAALRLPPMGELIRALPQPDSYTCSAKLAGRVLRGAGVGDCTFRIPKTARGKKLVVSVTVAYQGATKTAAFTYKIGR